MKAGKLRHRVTIQTPTRTLNARSGERTPTYADGPTVWAQVRPLTPRELRQQEQTVGQTLYTVSMRYRDGVTTTHRLRWEGRTLNITGVVNVNGLGVELQVLATESTT